MTVVKIQGSSLEEVYGTDVFSKPKRKKQGKRGDTTRDSTIHPNQHPNGIDDIFDYYESSNNEFEQTQSLQELQGTHPEYQRLSTHMPAVEADVLEHYSVQSNPRTHKDMLHKEEERENRYIDLGLYLFSGVFLIFIMEQFVNIGMALKSTV